jgi:hypothetical protein
LFGVLSLTLFPHQGGAMAIATSSVLANQIGTHEAEIFTLEKDSPHTVSPESLFLTFLKYKGTSEDQAITDHETVLSRVSGKSRFVCFHHYDEIRIVSIKGTMQDITDLFSLQVPDNIIAAKKMICYQLHGERSSGINLEDLHPVVEFALFRLNPAVAIPSLEFEASAVKWISDHIPKDVLWIAARTVTVHSTFVNFAS